MFIGLGLSLTNVALWSRGGGTPAPPPTLLAQPLVADAMNQQLCTGRAVRHGNGTYFATISSTKTGAMIELHRVRGGECDTFMVCPAVSYVNNDDHSIGQPLVLADGRVMVTYGSHSSNSAAFRYRVSREPLPNLEAGFSAEVVVPITAGGLYTYHFNFLFSDGTVEAYVRAAGTVGGWERFSAPSADISAGTATWSAVQITTSDTYQSIRQTGDRLDWLLIDGNVGGGAANTLRHCYMVRDTGEDQFYTTAGAPIATPWPSLASLTTVRSTGADANLALDVMLGEDGHPRGLFAYSPDFDDSAPDQTNTNISYGYARWSGSAWTWFDVMTGQYSMPDATHQLGSVAFSTDEGPALVYASKRNAVSGLNEIVSLAVDEANEEVAEETLIAADETYHLFRPFAPVNAGSQFKAGWIVRRAMTSFENFDTDMGFFGTPLLDELIEPESYDVDAAAVITAMETAQGGALAVNRKVLIDRWIRTLKADPVSGTNLWADRVRTMIAPFLLDSEAAAMVDWKLLSSWTKTGAPTFTAGKGVLGTTAAATDNWQSPVNISAISGWARDSWFNAGSVGRIVGAGTVGTIIANTYSRLYAYGAGLVQRTNSTTNGSAHNGGNYSSGVGVLMANRSASNAVQYYRHFDQYGTSAEASTAAPAQKIIFAEVAAGYARCYIGGNSLSAAEAQGLVSVMHRMLRRFGSLAADW